MKINQPISVIVKAYNEGKNIHRVLKPLLSMDFIDEIIVVNDGSIDNTAEVVKTFKSPRLRLVSHEKNQGMGAAMATGVESAEYDLLLFLDADLIGLKEEHILAILSPIMFTRKADLVLGVFALKKMSKDPGTKLANRVLPLIAGQRAIWRNALPPIDEIRKSHYGADLLIARNVPKKNRAVVKLDELSQVTKEKKAGRDFSTAIKARIKMYTQVIKVLLEENKH